MSDEKKKTGEAAAADEGELQEDELDQVAGGAWYAKFDGVDGSSTSKSHDKWIEVESFSWGVTQQGVTPTTLVKKK